VYAIGLGFIVGGTNASIAPCRVVCLDTGSTGVSRQVIQQTVAGAKSLGIAFDNMQGAPGVLGSDTAVCATTGNPIGISFPGQSTDGEFGSSANIGDELVSDTNGRLVPITNNAGSPVNQYVVAVCVQSVTVIGAAYPRIPVIVAGYWRYY
jgi:hypothetical protein